MNFIVWSRIRFIENASKVYWRSETEVNYFVKIPKLNLRLAALPLVPVLWIHSFQEPSLWTKLLKFKSTMFAGRFKLYTIIRLIVQAAPKLPETTPITMSGELNSTLTSCQNGTIRVLTPCLMYNMESEVKNSYWGLFGSYPLGSSSLASLLAPFDATHITSRIDFLWWNSRVGFSTILFKNPISSNDIGSWDTS